jgi:ComF family protein
MASLTTRLTDLALPATCPGCGREGEPICPRCRPALEVRLGRQPGVPIGLPGDLPAPLLQLEWSAPFTGTVRAALHALKYGGERRLATPLGEAAAERWRRVGAGGDLFVPVPVHADRARERGYDQAVLLADVIARRLGLPTARLLERHRRTVAQYELDRPHRGANVSGAFRLRTGGGLTGWGLAGRWIVLVDDVTTTGSTLAACAEVLLDAGALAVSGLTVARER